MPYSIVVIETKPLQFITRRLTGNLDIDWDRLHDLIKGRFYRWYPAETPEQAVELARLERAIEMLERGCIN